jgi:hypothetical protein
LIVQEFDIGICKLTGRRESSRASLIRLGQVFKAEEMLRALSRPRFLQKHRFREYKLSSIVLARERSCVNIFPDSHYNKRVLRKLHVLNSDSDDLNSFEKLLRVRPAISYEEDLEEMEEEGTPDDDDDDIPDDPFDPRYKLGKYLLKLSRVYYRHGQHYPDWFITKQKEICCNRSPAQIRRSLKNWMVRCNQNLFSYS